MAVMRWRYGDRADRESVVARVYHSMIRWKVGRDEVRK